MPSEKEQQQNAPNTARTYERCEPENETTSGEMGEVRNTPHDAPDSVQGSVRNDESDMEMTADDVIDEASEASATGDRAGGKADVDPADAVPAATGRSGTGHVSKPLGKE